MSLKLHFMDSQVEYFPENLGNYSVKKMVEDSIKILR